MYDIEVSGLFQSIIFCDIFQNLVLLPKAYYSVLFLTMDKLFYCINTAFFLLEIHRCLQQISSSAVWVEYWLFLIDDVCVYVLWGKIYNGGTTKVIIKKHFNAGLYKLYVFCMCISGISLFPLFPIKSYI
jgi:hypothetical protein